MGMDVDDAGCENQAVGIDRLSRRAGYAAHFGNAPVLDSDVGGPQRSAGAVGNHGALDN